jgi:hypothetical protein
MAASATLIMIAHSISIKITAPQKETIFIYMFELGPNAKEISQETSQQAASILFDELTKGRTSGEENGWLTLEDVEKRLGIIHR